MDATVRTFRAPDPRSALAAVKNALGPDAVILATREVAGGLFRPAEIEITAALSSAPSAALPRAVPARATHAYGAAVPAPMPPDPQPARPGMDGMTASRDVMSSLLSVANPAMEGSDLPAVGRSAVQRLKDSGLADGLADQLVRQAGDAVGYGTLSGLLENVRHTLVSRLHVAPAPWKDQVGRVMALVGPTGVGKTTTVAKMAARAMMEAGLRVGLITVDTYRIGASNQLARYGEILEAPTYLARNAEELAAGIRACASCQLVLVDTAGRFETGSVLRQAALLRSVPNMELFATFSAATGWREIEANVRRYAPLRPDGYILTKLDEAVAPGCLFSVELSARQPLVATTDGQSIPEDLHPADPLRLVDLVLK